MFHVKHFRSNYWEAMRGRIASPSAMANAYHKPLHNQSFATQHAGQGVGDLPTPYRMKHDTKLTI